MSGSFVPEGDNPAELALRGFARAHADLVALADHPLYLYSRDRHPDRLVGLVSGGGSGHEPLHAGFLGRGMLDAVAPGRVFASPHNRQVYAASRQAAGPGGVLHIVKNYTGDRINFAIAAERLANDGIAVRRVLVDDDIATDSDQTSTGRRGTAATLVVEKVLGAAADHGLSLDALADLGAQVAAASRSLAVAARAQTSLQSGEPAFEIAVGELEYGVGIHGERAAASVARPGLEQLVRQMCDEILLALPSVAGQSSRPGAIALVVNGLGSATQLELYAIFELAASVLADSGCSIVASCVGTFVPALDMHGFSLTVSRLEPQWIEWFHRPVRIAATPFAVAPLTEAPLTDAAATDAAATDGGSS